MYKGQACFDGKIFDVTALVTNCRVSRAAADGEIATAKRNFATVLRGITRNEINPLVYQKLNWCDAKGVAGLQKLLMYEQSFLEFRNPSCKCIGRAFR